MSARILIIDDEESIRFSLRGVLEDEGHEVIEAGSGEQGLEMVENQGPDLVFLDIWLPGMDGLHVLEKVREGQVDVPVIMISGHGNVETAVSAIKKGAFDFIEKPLSLEKVVITVNKALEFGKLLRENLELRAQVNTDRAESLTGNAPSIVRLREQVARVAPTDAWVLITGENGTGKEIVARQVHAGSRRSKRPMIAVNCAAIPEELIESELFGHEKGSFTGADKAQAGKFELANHGTLFLDEIGDMSLKTQAKILRILQEQSFERIGGRKTITVDVRVIAATNKDLPTEIKAGNFREDLYYRLKVFPLEVPPLRKRAEDIPLLIEEFLDLLVRAHNFKPLTFTPEALEILQRYPWPGNVRELKNFVERMLIMYAGQMVGPRELPPEITGGIDEDHVLGSDLACQPDLDLKTARMVFETRFLEAKLRECSGSVSKLADAVGMERSSLYRKLKAYNIQVQE
ncbi:CheY-like receiver, AAA-type ATPase, and DNA-binding domain containing response regulator [Desulfocurvibacter africanus PCS]|uniref:CheY-like receiver, AAA-type ATPase, and DNA-binding domain containing response regulator n=1 Tax=Desulfocurvibacter africanus PCS TaxID=1262666 RepID=M5PWH4_DESAF|nr:sigma-54 dependent transcriptional regulator [Desulfocurvibacter africanus]EMG38662.1 CheY-like receiver, AAA-type ATPase, and DNA-binding domain containing response regulator [Desulfocurvibacter africanus PCS]